MANLILDIVQIAFMTIGIWTSAGWLGTKIAIMVDHYSSAK
jgi:hypothetical protein